MKIYYSRYLREGFRLSPFLLIKGKRVFLLFLFFLFTITFVLFSPCVKAETDSTQPHRIIKSASELDYPPFALVLQDKSASGFSVELLRAVCRAVDMDVNFEIGPWHEIKRKLGDGVIDVLPLMSFSPEREKVFDFTAPYLRMHGTIFVRKGEREIRGEDDLKSREVLVMRGDTAHEYAISRGLSDNLILTETFGDAMKRLSRGEGDAVIVQQVVGHQIIKELGIKNVVDISAFKNRNFKPVVKPLSGFEQKFCIAVQKENHELLTLLNEGLAIIIADGTYDTLYDKWFEPILPKPPIPISRVLKYSLTIILPLLLFWVLFGIWFLRQEVSRKTNDLRREIDQRKKLEEELRRSRDSLENKVQERTNELKRRAEQLAKLSSELTLTEQRERYRIANVLHDQLQQLLVGAKINQEVLINELDDNLKSTAERVLDLINQSVQEMRSLHGELAPPVLNSGDLSALLKWHIRWLYENQNFEVDLQYEFPIVIDRKDIVILLFHSIRELLLNVVKHAGVKSATVRIEQQKENLLVIISDHGKGFNTENIGDNAEYDKKFGLISIRERLMNLRGHFNIESTPGAGTTISMSVPLGQLSTVGEASEIGFFESSALTSTEKKEQPGKLRIMLVDDHMVVREGLSNMLNSHSDIEVVGEASNGENAAKLSREIIPDVILMDINMPVMNGLEATKIIHSEFPHIRIVGLSMYDEDDQAETMINAGASAYRSKSGDIDSLLSAIRGEG